MKKSKLFIISSIALLFAIAGLTVYAFYNFFYRNNGSTLSLVEVVFSVNDSNVKNKNDVVYFSTDDMSQGDGYEIVLNYSINGSFSSTNAVRYSTYFQSLTGGIDGERNIANGVEVYRFNGENYEYLDNLGNLISQTTPVMTDYLGSTGTNREKFMLVYGEATVVENRVPFGLQISTTSEVVATDAENFPFYYLANLGKNSAESILEQLPKNSAVYGRTIVLTKDINYQGGDITFDHVVGIDLNGHTLNLNGAKFTIKDTANGSEPFLTDLAIIDSKDSGSVTNGSITLNLSKTVMDVDTELLSYVTVSNINMSIFEERLQNSLNDIASQKRLMNTESNDTFSYHFDALRGLKFYVKKGTVSVAISGSDESVSYNSSDCTFDVTGLETSNIVYVAITATKSGSEPAIANANLSLYGKSLQDAAEYLMNYVPKVIEGSIYLPQYLPKFNAYVTWISFDDDLINSNGTVLQNGYINLDSWVSKNTKLGFVLDQSGEIKNGIIDNITIQVLSEEERAKLLHDHSITMFDYQTITSYSFNVVDVLLYKREVDFSVANLALFNKIKEIATNEFGITLETAYDSSNISGCIATLKDEFKTKIFTKLGIEEINVSAVNEAPLYVTNEKDINDNIVSVRQISLPKNTIDLVYNVNYVFESGNTVTEHKTIDVSNGEATTTATDVANTIRVPFDTYTRTMTNPIYTSPYVYASFVDTFEIVSDFSGAQISYQVDDEFKDYVEIITTGEGASLKKFVHIITSKSPAETTDVKVYYTIGDVTNYVTFKLVGILHNGIEIKDANLYVELLTNYDVNKDNILTILEAEHASGNSFACNSKGIVSLYGLRYFTNITSLTMNTNKIMDIDDLAYLNNLSYLDLSSNYITDISSLRYLDSLTTINLSNNQVTDISPIQYLTNISKLYLQNNRISDFQYVQNLTTLSELKVFGNVNSYGESTVITNEGESGYIQTLRRSNQYYFALLKGKKNGCKMYILSDSEYTGFGNTKEEALLLNKIVPVSEVHNVISLPTYVYDKNGESYEITYHVESSDKPYVNIERESNIHVTNVTISQIPVDNEVSIYAYTTGFDTLNIYRKLTFVILEGGDAGQIELKDESGNTFCAYANVVIPDLKLRAELFRNFDEDGNGKIKYGELTATKTLNLEYAGVKSLSGLQYFTGITSLNLRGNVLDDASDLWYVSYLQNLKTLKVNGQEFDYDYLVYFSTKDKTSYEKHDANTFVVKDINAANHNVIGTFGLTSLETLNVNGSYNLDSEEAKTELYHVYLNNNVNIYIQDDSTTWDPIGEEVSKLIGSMTTSATFINLNDQVQIAQNYKFYLYDDLIPISFSLTYTAPNGTYYNHNYNSDNAIPNLYYFDDDAVSTSQLNANTPKRVGNYNNIGCERLFSSSSSKGILTITYIKLASFEFTTYASMTLESASSLWNNKSITKASIKYSLSLNVQFNDSYKLYNDVDETDPVNNNGEGTPLNKVFGSIESIMLIMDAITSQIYGQRNGIVETKDNKGFDNSGVLRCYYYSVTDVNGNISYYYKEGTNTVKLCDDKDDAISRVEEYTTSKSVYYDGAIQAGKVYRNGFYLYVSQLKKDFQYNGKAQTQYFVSTSIELLLCIKLAFAETVTDGLQYLPIVESIGASNGMNYGDGHTLVNARIIRDVYGYVNISTITTPLPKLEVWNVCKYYMTELAVEDGVADSDPAKLVASYLVYFPNLRSFISRIAPDSGEIGSPITDWSAFLVYSYIPFGQTINPEFNKTGSMDMDDSLIGGMSLQDNKLYYYDSSYGMQGCFRVVYNASGEELDVTDYSSTSLVEVDANGYYKRLFIDENQNALPSTAALFRKSQKNQLNYFLVAQDKTNSGTTNHKTILTQFYLNAKPTVKTWYFHLYALATGDANKGLNNGLVPVNGQAGKSYGDWTPGMEPVYYEPTSNMEWDEFYDYIAHLDVKLNGYIFDGTALVNAQYDSINWNSYEYTDLFRRGLTVTLPSKLSEFLTGYSSLDSYRDFDVTWRLISLNGSSLQTANVSGSYTFNADGYYILSAKVAGKVVLLYEFSITNKSSNFTEWYEKIIDKTLKYLVFKSGGSSVTQLNFDYSNLSLDATNISASDAKKFFPSTIYSIEGIDSLTSLTSLTLNGFNISYIPSLPTSITSLTLKKNLIGDIGDILNGSKYTNLSTVNLSNNYLDLTESNFKNGSYYTTRITSLVFNDDPNYKSYYNTTQLSYFNNLNYYDNISIYFMNNLYFNYGTWNYNAFSTEMLTTLETLLTNQPKIKVYVSQHSWDNTEINLSIISNIRNAYNSVQNPAGDVTFSGGSIDEEKAYNIVPVGGLSKDDISVSMVWNGSHWDGTNYYQKMVRPWYLVIVKYNDYKIVKELQGYFFEDHGALSSATLNGISITQLQDMVDHRVLEQIYKNSTFNGFAGTFNATSIDLSGLYSETLDLKGLSSFTSLATITCNSGQANFVAIKNYNDNNITSIAVNNGQQQTLLNSITGSRESISYTFNTPVSRNLVNRNVSGTTTSTFSNNSVTVVSKYNYSLTNTFTISSLKTKVYSEIVNSTNNTGEFYDIFKDGNGSIANLTSLHINKGIRFYGANLYSDSQFRMDDKDVPVNIISYGINVNTNNKRILTNGAYISPNEIDKGRRYVVINTGSASTSSKYYFPKSFVFNGETISITYSSSSNLGLDNSNANYCVMTPGSITESTDDILVTATYNSTSYSGTIGFYVDVKAGLNPVATDFTETITNWYVEMQDGSLVYAGDIFESPVLAANIFNGIGKVLFSTKVVSTDSPANNANSTNPEAINGNLLMEEVYINDALCKVLRQSVIAKIQSMTDQARVFMYFGGLEIFYNLKSICFTQTAGYDFSFASNLKLETFVFTHKRNSITTIDFSFLNNSRDTLKRFEYYYSDGKDITPLQDMSWLLSFNNLTKVTLKGPDRYEMTPTFHYFLTAMYLKYHNENIVTYNSKNYSSLNIPDSIKSAATIMYNLSSFDTSSDSSFIYQNGFELFSKDGKIEENRDYYLPSYLYSAGDYYKIQWNSLSSFIDISVIYNNSIITISEYENQYKEWKKENPDESDYEFCKDYTIKVNFKNLSSVTSYKGFVSMKIEYQSKFSDVYTPVMTAITDMSENYAKYYKASYSALGNNTEFVKNKYYYNDGGTYKLLLVEPDDWDSNTSNYYDKIYTVCESNESYSSGTTYYTRYIYEPHMFERILTINLAKNNRYKQILLNNDSYSHSDYVKNNNSIYDGTAIKGDYTSVVSSNSSVIDVVEHNVTVAETRYFIKVGNNYVNINASNYDTYLTEKGDSTTVFYQYVGRLCAGTGWKNNTYYRYNSETNTYELFSSSSTPTGWASTCTNYYTFTKFSDFDPYKKDSNYKTTLGAIADKLNVTTKVYGIYLKDPTYTGLVTITCTLSDGTTEEYYVYWER